MEDKELLEEAKRRYPVGTSVVCLFSEDVNEIVSSECEFDDDGDLWIDCGSMDSMIYDHENGEWAKVYSEPKYTKEDVVEFANYAIRETWNPITIEESKTTTELFDLWVKSKENKNG